MGANIEHQLLCKIIEQRDFHAMEKLRIDESFFLSDSQTKEIYRFIKSHYHDETTYGSVPSWQLIQQRFYGFPWSYSYDTVETLCQELRKQKLRSQLLTLTDDVIQRADVDPSAALSMVKEAAASLSSEHEISSDLLLSDAYDKLYEDYQLTASGHGITGIPWPWDVLNEDTQGMHPGNFIVFYGRPKHMKTWVGMVVAANAYMKGQRVLVYSLEMHEKDILRRIAAIIAQVDYKKLKSGKLDPLTEQKFWQILLFLRDEELGRKNISGLQSAFLAVHPRSKSSGVNSLQAKIREFRPTLVIVDAMYLMRDDRSRTRSVEWKNVANISQDLKETAMTFEVPLIGIMQANRQAEKDPKKADVSEIAYADALGQDCDLSLRITKQFDQGTHEPELVCSLPSSREGTLDNFVIHGVPATNFSFKRMSVQDPNAGQAPQGQGGPPPPAQNNQPPNPRAGGRNPPPIAVNYRK